ncbi:MAG: acetaldehyde dehydrogenase [Massilia sp.]|nr:acetaldehyde dehydrogenase [Massilia sp.]
MSEPMATSLERVTATPAALGFIEELRQRHGPLMFFQSGGCCDGSAPMCYAAGEFALGDTDVYLGNLGGTPFYMGFEQFGYWEHTQLIIDVVPGNGGMFSLDNGTGRRFLTRSRLFTDGECALLRSQPPRQPA